MQHLTSAIAILVAVSSAIAGIKLGRRMLFHGIASSDGGGWTAALLALVLVSLCAFGFALH